MEKDHERKSHWFDVTPGQAIQGLLANHGEESRVYAVTINTPAEYHYIHDRWPRLVELNMETVKGPQSLQPLLLIGLTNCSII